MHKEKFLQVGKLFIALRNKSNELRALTGDGRLDVMDILLEFTRIVKEGDNFSRKDFHLLQHKNRTRSSPENNNKVGRRQTNDFKEKDNTPSGEHKSLSYSNSPTERFRYHDINMRRMTFSQYKDMLETYARSKGRVFHQKNFIQGNITEKKCF